MLALIQPEDGNPLVPLFVGGGVCYSNPSILETPWLSQWDSRPHALLRLS